MTARLSALEYLQHLDETPSVARCATQQRDPARRGRTNAFNADAQGFVEFGMCHCPRARTIVFTHPREATELQIRRSGFVPMDRYECTTSRLHGNRPEL